MGSSKTSSMVVDNYQLSYDSYMEHLVDVMQTMLTGSDFADLTLVCDDMEMVKSHKAILSACSPVFKKMLQFSKDSTDTMIFLKGFKKEEVESLLQFVLTGEVVVNKSKANRILKIAEDFKFKGVNVDPKDAQDIAENNENNDVVEDQENEDHDVSMEENVSNDVLDLLAEPIIKEEVHEEEVKEMKDKAYKCVNPECNMSFTDKSNCLRHYKKKHEVLDNQLKTWKTLNKTIIGKEDEEVPDKKYKCSSLSCKKSYNDRSNLLRHFRKQHKGENVSVIVTESNTGTNENVTNLNESEAAVDHDFFENVTVEMDVKDEEVDEMEKKMYSCDYPGCSKSFTDKVNKSRHYKQKHLNHAK